MDYSSDGIFLLMLWVQIQPRATNRNYLRCETESQQGDSFILECIHKNKQTNKPFAPNTVPKKCIRKTIRHYRTTTTIRYNNGSATCKIKTKCYANWLTKIYRTYVHTCPQESRREGWTDAAIMLCKLNQSL